MMEFSYVYILVSEFDPARHYVGLTDDLKDDYVGTMQEVGTAKYTSVAAASRGRIQ